MEADKSNTGNGFRYCFIAQRRSFLKTLEIQQPQTKKFNINLPEEKTENIGFHFVNAQTNEHDMYRTMMMTNMMKDILNIVKRHFKIIIKAL